MSIPRRLGRLARGFVNNLQDDDRFRETLRVGRERGETLRETFGDAFGAAWRGASEEWNTAEEERRASEGKGAGEPGDRGSGRNSSENSSYRQRSSSTSNIFTPLKYPLPVLKAYERLGLDTGTGIEEVNRKRRELVKRYHPDRFSDPEKRVRAERLTSEINAAHDTITRHLSRR